MTVLPIARAGHTWGYKLKESNKINVHCGTELSTIRLQILQAEIKLQLSNIPSKRVASGESSMEQWLLPLQLEPTPSSPHPSAGPTLNHRIKNEPFEHTCNIMELSMRMRIGLSYIPEWWQKWRATSGISQSLLSRIDLPLSILSRTDINLCTCVCGGFVQFYQILFCTPLTWRASAHVVLQRRGVWLGHGLVACSNSQTPCWLHSQPTLHPPGCLCIYSAVRLSKFYYGGYTYTPKCWMIITVERF